MEWTFGTLLWSTLLFFLWFAVIWMFIAVFADIFRRDMSGWAKAGWLCLIVVLPFLGILAYVIARPSTGAQAYGPSYDNRAYDNRSWGSVEPRPSASEEIARASELYERGRISETEYQSLKRQALA